MILPPFFSTSNNEQKIEYSHLLFPVQIEMDKKLEYVCYVKKAPDKEKRVAYATLIIKHRYRFRETTKNEKFRNMPLYSSLSFVVSRRAIAAWYRYIKKAQVYPELRTVMYHVTYTKRT